MSKHGAYVIGVSDCNQEVCAASGRISTQSGTALEIFERSHDAQKNTALIGKVTKSGHTSTVEHIFFNLAFENVSVAVEQFMIEFRLASFTVKSRRYVDFSTSGYFVPEELDGENKEKYQRVMEALFGAYCALTERGIPKEDARFVLPYCFYSNFYCSLNGRELINVLTAMLYGRGKKIREIYEIGLSLLDQCKQYAPGLFVDFEIKASRYTDDFAPVLEWKQPATSRESDGLCQILSHTPDGEKNVARAALIEKYNYAPAEIESILENEDNIQKIMTSLCACSRPRALESYTCTVRFNDVSLACLTHFARHRMQSICIPDLMTASREKYIVPETVKADGEALAIYHRAFAQMRELYGELKDCGYGDSVLIYCVLSGNTLDFVTTMNARELRLFFRLRSCTRAQWEIQNYANDLLFKLRELSPGIFSHFGPSCYADGVCPEGRMTCGRAAEIREKFRFGN